MPDEITKITNPYLPPRPDDANIQCNVSRDDYNLIKSTCLRTGTITGVMGTLWNKLCNELKSRGITDVTKQDEFERFVANCVILPGDDYEQLKIEAAGGSLAGLSNRPTGGSVRDSGAPLHGGGVAQHGAAKKAVSSVSTDVPSGSGAKRKGKGNDQQS